MDYDSAVGYFRGIIIIGVYVGVCALTGHFLPFWAVIIVAVFAGTIMAFIAAMSFTAAARSLMMRRHDRVSRKDIQWLIVVADPYRSVDYKVDAYRRRR